MSIDASEPDEAIAARSGSTTWRRRYQWRPSAARARSSSLIPLELFLGLGDGYPIGHSGREAATICATTTVKPAADASTTATAAGTAQLNDALAMHRTGKLDEALKIDNAILITEPTKKQVCALKHRPDRPKP